MITIAILEPGDSAVEMAASEIVVRGTETIKDQLGDMAIVKPAVRAWLDAQDTLVLRTPPPSEGGIE